MAKELEGKGGLYLDNVQVVERADEDDPGFYPGWKDWVWNQELAERLWSDSLSVTGLQETG